MKKSVISFKINKRSRKKSFVDALCDQLGDHVVYVPVLATENQDDENVTVRVVKLTKGADEFVPVFASEKGLALWQKETGHSGEWLALFGSDLCAALANPSVFLSFFPGDGQGSAVMLAPEMVERIAESGAETAWQRFGGRTPSMQVLDIGGQGNGVPAACREPEVAVSSAAAPEGVIDIVVKESPLPQ